MGNYRLRFTDNTGLLYAPEFYDNQLTLESAQNIQVGAGVIKGPINAQLAPFSRISGQVTDGNLNPLNNINVTVFRQATNAQGQHDQGGHIGQ